MLVLAIFNSVLIFYAILKVMFFMTVFKSFATMIRLVKRSLVTI